MTFEAVNPLQSCSLFAVGC